MDRCRLDIRLHDKIPFTEKADRVIFRGSVKSSEQRRRFIETFRDNPRIDTADTRSGHSAQETGTAKQITLYAHLDSKFIMTFEGNDIASNIRWVMSTNSIAVMPRPRNESWFMEGRLRPGYHYIEVRDDYSDLEEKIDYYIAHPEQAQQIIDHANDFARQFYDSRRERFISLLVMKKYFEKTGQLSPTNRRPRHSIPGGWAKRPPPGGSSTTDSPCSTATGGKDITSWTSSLPEKAPSTSSRSRHAGGTASPRRNRHSTRTSAGHSSGPQMLI